jgi:hypothetical protein
MSDPTAGGQIVPGRNFQIYVYDGTSALKDLPVNSLAMKGTDIVYEHNLSGPYYLTINTECNWHIIVKG